MGIDQAGRFMPCRWMSKEKDTKDVPTINTHDIKVYFQKDFAKVRNEILNGNSPYFCKDCNQMDQHGKISGRKKQLLKIGVIPDFFNNSLLSSPWMDEFKYSAKNNGDTKLLPVDWQIDLGNFCNSGCIFCHPTASSVIASEWKKIGLISNIPKGAWCNDNNLLQKFINILKETPHIRYLHFIGGETIITPAFKKILESLVSVNRTDLIIGFTTNLTVWDNSIIELLSKFKLVHVGLSIEALHPVNDYVRWPSKINQVEELLNKWVKEAKNFNWLTQIRITPTIFTVSFLDNIYRYAWENNLSVESCNFLNDPPYLRPTVLPEEFREIALKRLTHWINESKQQIDSTDLVINIRHPDTIKSQLIQDAESYVRYLNNEEYETNRLPQLIKYLKLIENNRNNSILDYVPEYEEFLRSAGY